MKKYMSLSRLQKEPLHVRRRIAFWGAVCVTLVVVFVWGAGMIATIENTAGRADGDHDEEVNPSSPFRMIGASFRDMIRGIREDAGNPFAEWGDGDDEEEGFDESQEHDVREDDTGSDGVDIVEFERMLREQGDDGTDDGQEVLSDASEEHPDNDNEGEYDNEFQESDAEGGNDTESEPGFGNEESMIE